MDSLGPTVDFKNGFARGENSGHVLQLQRWRGAAIDDRKSFSFWGPKGKARNFHGFDTLRNLSKP